MKIQQLFIDAHNCSGNLDDNDKIMSSLTDGAHQVGADIRRTFIEKFSPQGLTGVLVLAESHIIISTWPENRFACLDILLCNDTMDPEIVWSKIEPILAPEHVKRNYLIRGSG